MHWIDIYPFVSVLNSLFRIFYVFRKELAAILDDSLAPAREGASGIDVRTSRDSKDGTKNFLGTELKQFLISIASEYGIDPSEVNT